MSDEPGRWHFDPVDVAHMRLLAKLSPGQRIRAMLAGREVARGLIIDRLRREFPDLTPRELALRLADAGDLETPEIASAAKAAARCEAERLAGAP